LSASDPGSGPSVDGIVTEVVYAGATTRVVVDAGQTTLSVTIANSTPDHRQAQRGDHVRLAWTDEALHALTD